MRVDFDEFFFFDESGFDELVLYLRHHQDLPSFDGPDVPLILLTHLNLLDRQIRLDYHQDCPPAPSPAGGNGRARAEDNDDDQ